MLFVRPPEAKVRRLMDSGYSSRGRFQRGGSFGYRGGDGRGWAGPGRGLFRGAGANRFASTSGFGNSGAMRPFGANQGPRQPGFGTTGRGFDNWGSGRARGSFANSNWSGSMGSGNGGGAFGGAYGPMSSSSGGLFSSEQSAGYNDASCEFGSMGRGRGFTSSQYDDTAGQYGQ